MVFEKLVTDLVNKYLGDFIENLDPNQLKIGIWGGGCFCQILKNPLHFAFFFFLKDSVLSLVIQQKLGLENLYVVVNKTKNCCIIGIWGGGCF